MRCSWGGSTWSLLTVMAEQPGEEPFEALSIGEVIDVLRDEFPDVTVSKLRFLESQGLLAPGRSEGGYRQFDRHDIERLRFILRQQRDHFLPLKVIKSKLTLWERGEERVGGEVVAASEMLDQGGEPVSRSELLRRSGLGEPELEALVEHGLLRPAGPDLFPGGAVGIASEARRLFAQGLEARHLRVIMHAAEREADVLGQLTAPLLRMRNPDARERARDVLSESGEAIFALHRGLLTEELRRLIGS